MPTQLDKIKIRIKILIVHELKTKMYSLKTLSGWQKIYVNNSQNRAYVKKCGISHKKIVLIE